MSLIIYEITFVRTETHESHKYDPKSEDKDACHVQTAGFSNYIGHIYVCTAAKVDRRTSGLRTRIEHWGNGINIREFSSWSRENLRVLIVN